MLSAFRISGISLSFGGKTIESAKIFLENKFLNKLSFYMEVVCYRERLQIGEESHRWKEEI
jgi:hypothetical protein